MTAPERFADSQIPLAPRAPSIHDPTATSSRLTASAPGEHVQRRRFSGRPCLRARRQSVLQTNLNRALPIAHASRHEPVEPKHRLRNACLIERHDLAQVLGVHATRERRRAHEIAENQGEPWRRSAVSCGFSSA